MESKAQTPKHGALHALTAAALALPGLMQSAPAVAQTPDNAVVTQFGHYEEGNRELYGVSSKFKPLETDSIQASTWFTPTDRLTATVNFRQDTWSGATPISTAPQEWRENRSRAPDGVSGASPYIAPGGLLFLDKKTLQPLATDGFGNLTGNTNTQLVHTISGASRETRMALDFNLRQQWDNAAMNFGAGVSSEPDYLSRFAAGGGQWDFNQKLTSVNFGLSYTASSNKAILDHDAAPYIFNACGNATCNFVSSVSRIETESNGNHILYGDRHDGAATIGLTQILNQNAQVQTNLAYTRSQGYLTNPYKVVEVAFIDPAQQFLSPSPDALFVTVNSMLDNRPDLRNQWLWNIRYAQYIESTDAGLHLNYSYFGDDWGIHAHTLEFQWAQPVGDGWTLTPMLRYYTQSAAYFYTPYLVTAQGEHTTTVDPVTGKPVSVPFDLSKLPTYYSSDYRLSGYGALGGGLTITKQFSKGVTFYLGGEYYKHAGGLKAGGGGEGSYSDFNSWLVNASLQFAMDAPGTPSMGGSGMEDHSAHMGHAGHEGHSGALAPAGVMFAHTMEKAGDFMAGLRYVNSRQAGSILHGSTDVNDTQLKTMGCEGTPCLTSPTTMPMEMYMLELMYAPADWVTLMVMPQYMNMAMSQRGLLSSSEQAQLPPALSALALRTTPCTTIHPVASATPASMPYSSFSNRRGTSCLPRSASPFPPEASTSSCATPTRSTRALIIT